MKKMVRQLPYISLSGVFTGKMLIALILISTTVYLDFAPIYIATESLGINVNCGIISILLSDSFSRNIIFIAVLFAFSNLPIKYPIPYYSLIRAGKRSWLFSQLLYVIVVSILLMGFIIIISIITFKGHMFYGTEWGKIINSLLTGTFQTEFSIEINISPNVLAEFTPAAALVWTILSTTIMFIIFGFIMVLMNLAINEFAGIVINGIMIFMNMLCELFSSFLKYYYSPLSWCSLSVIDSNGYGATPSVVFAVSAWTIMLIIMFIFAMIISEHNKEIIGKSGLL